MNVHVCARPKFVFCLFQNVKDRASRTQSESSLLALLRRRRFSSVAQHHRREVVSDFRRCKVTDKKKATEFSFHRRKVSESFSESFGLSAGLSESFSDFSPFFRKVSESF